MQVVVQVVVQVVQVEEGGSSVARLAVVRQATGPRPPLQPVHWRRWWLATPRGCAVAAAVAVVAGSRRRPPSPPTRWIALETLILWLASSRQPF